MTCPFCLSTKTIFFASKENYKFQRCLICRGLFIKTTPSKKSLYDYYKKQFLYADGRINEPIIRKRSKKILQNLRMSYPEAMTICDVGSGHGYFLDEASRMGFEVFGIEPSKQLANAASINYAIPQFVGTLESFIKINKNKFDVVTCIHVIEHVMQPKDFMHSLLKLVKPEGILFLETPNADSHLVTIEKNSYTFLIPPEHLWIFSKKSIEKLLPKNAFISYTHTYSYPEHFMGIVKKIINANKKANNNSNTGPNRQINKFTNNQNQSLRKWFSYILFDKIIAPLLTPLLNVYHKGSILELYISKKVHKCGL